MALSAEEKSQLDALIAKEKEADPDEDFEIEIYDGPKGARLPYSRGRSYLQSHFGIDLDPDPGEGTGKEGAEGAAKPASKTKPGDGKESEAQGYWTKRSSTNRKESA